MKMPWNITSPIRDNNWFGFIIPTIYVLSLRCTPNKMCTRGRCGLALFAVLWRWEWRIDVWRYVLSAEEAQRRFCT